eukprot:5418621-Heterocapsa_arctica.AAC.1
MGTFIDCRHVISTLPSTTPPDLTSPPGALLQSRPACSFEVWDPGVVVARGSALRKWPRRTTPIRASASCRASR